MEEKTAQEDYEELMADSAEKRAGDSKTITEKEAQKVYGFGCENYHIACAAVDTI